jgi:hypothetical protein
VLGRDGGFSLGRGGGISSGSGGCGFGYSEALDPLLFSIDTPDLGVVSVASEGGIDAGPVSCFSGVGEVIFDGEYAGTQINRFNRLRPSRWIQLFTGRNTKRVKK